MTRVKTKSQKVLWVNSYVCRNYRGKTGRRRFCPPPPPLDSRIYTCLIFESTDFIKKGNSRKSNYLKASKTTYNRAKIHLKLLKLAISANSDSTGDKF